MFVSFKRIETQVQPYVARILMARSLLESIIPAIVSLFIGPWSDKFGRRPIVLTTFTGKLKNKIITKQINQKLMLEKSCIANIKRYPSQVKKVKTLSSLNIYM